MDVVLPLRIKNEKKFFECAFKLGFDEMSAQKLFYITHQSDMDIFPRMGDERLNILLYCWEMCEDYKLKLNQEEWELPEELEAMLKIMVPWSLDVWFSKEWDRCKLLLKHALIHCLNRARGLFLRLPDMMQINWDFLLLYNLTPWQVGYLKSLNVTKDKTLENGALTIETEEQIATPEDIAYLKLEQLPLIVLRLVKLFDQSSIDMVKTLCMRVIAAWNKVYYTELETGGTRLPYVLPEDKRCLLLICHIYLMAVYETDDAKGYVIDNMINNVRFYYQGFQTSYAMDNMKYTPARFIALTCIHLRLQKREFFDFVIWNSYDTAQVKLFGVVSQAYKSYLLGNLLMELNNMNEDDFAANMALYKRLMNSYVNEREKSEIFMLNELQKQEAQRYAHNIIQCVQNITDIKSKICKGNRMSNIGNYENNDDTTKSVGEIEGDVGVDKKEDDLRVDPIFQNIPNNQDILYYVYDVLSKKSYTGWHFAKIVLLFKIISHELNMIETWRYHPGLTINFMLNLEMKLSQHYTDLAKIFIDHPFIEQEFWLTAFYLNPTSYNYEAIKRLGIRSNRKRNDDQGRWVTGKDKIEAKYGLLSSTIDVKEITNLSNTEERNKDYEPLFRALCSLRLPDSMVKDILTVVFLPRNKSFSWAVDWGDLRRRCKMLISNSAEKKRFVELNMAEANDRLKFLKIDYEKYKNRPQLDYGSIEQGYENLINSTDIDDESEEESEEEDFEDDEDVYETQKGRGTKKQAETIEDDNSQEEEDPYLTGKRRTRARAAAAMASLLFTSDLGNRRKRRKKDDEETPKENEAAEADDKSNDSKSAETVVSLTPSVMEEASSTMSDIPKRNIKECLKERPVYANPTKGFRPLIDMWNIEKSDLEKIDVSCASLMESSSVLQRFTKLKTINKEINPVASTDAELIDHMELIIDEESLAVVESENTGNTSIPAQPFESIRIKEEPAEAEVLEEIVKSMNSQENEQASQKENNVPPVKSPTNDPPNIVTNVDDINSKNSSSNKTVSEMEDNEMKDDDMSTPNEDNLKPIDDHVKTNELIKYNDTSSIANKENKETIEGQQESSNTETNEELGAQKHKTKIDTPVGKDKKSIGNDDIKQSTEAKGKDDNTSTDNNEETKNGQEKQGTIGSNATESNDNSKSDDINKMKESVMGENSISDVMKENVEQTHKVTEQTDSNESTPTIADKTDTIPMEVVAEEKHCKEISEGKIDSDITDKVYDSEQNDIEMHHEPESGISIVENQQTNAMEIDNLRDHDTEMSIEKTTGKSVKRKETTSPVSQQIKTSDTLTEQNVKSIQTVKRIEETAVKTGQVMDINMSEIGEKKTAEKIETISDEVTVKVAEEKLNKLSDQCDGNDDTTKPLAGKKQDSDIMEVDSVDIVDKILQQTMDSKIEASLGAGIVNEIKLNEQTSPLLGSPSSHDQNRKDQESGEATKQDEVTQSLEIKPADLLEIKDIKAPEKLQINETSKDNKMTTGSGDGKTIANDDGKSNECIKTIDQQDDKINLTTNEREIIKIEIPVEVLHINKHGFDMPLLDTEDGYSDGEESLKYSNLKKLCLIKPVKVLMPKLRPADLTNLRQPKVRVKRITNIDAFIEKTRVQRKRVKRTVYLDESSDNSLLSNSSSSETYRPTKCKTKTALRRHVLRQTRTSDSDCDSIKSNLNIQKRRLSTSNTSSNQSNHTSRSSSRHTGGSNLVVTPRSASGLKLRISHADQKTQKSNATTIDEIIQLSSSSNDTNTMDSVADVVEILDDGDVADPLFEEEMVI